LCLLSKLAGASCGEWLAREPWQGPLFRASPLLW